MSKTFLFIGASSAVSQHLAAQLAGNTVIGISTKDLINANYSKLYRVSNYLRNTLPEIEETIDALVYFPGTIDLKPFHRLSETDFLDAFQINALGAVASIQKYLPNLKKSNHASIVLISTVASECGMPFHASIAMSKGAIESLTRSLAAEFAPAIRVNCVAPSLTQTPIAEKLLNTPEKIEAGNKRHPLKRIGKVEDIANAIDFLMADNSSWITGQILHVDGGMSTLNV
jgi:3-oxoacyl-[acyl-carrier protein] reductase